MINRFHAVATAACVVFSGSAIATAASYTLAPSQDTFVYANPGQVFPGGPTFNNTNFNAGPFSIYLGTAKSNSAHDVASLIQFDLSQLIADGVSSGEVASATLNLYSITNGFGAGTPNASFPVDVSVYKAAASWNAATATWNSGTPAADGPALDTTTVNSINTFVQFDLLSAMDEWLDAPVTNFGLRLDQDARVHNGSNEVGATFRSSAFSDVTLRPFLTITTVPEPSAIMLAAMGVVGIAGLRRRSRRSAS